MQREKRTKEREQYELEHEDAQMGFSVERMNEEDLLAQIEMMKR